MDNLVKINNKQDLEVMFSKKGIFGTKVLFVCEDCHQEFQTNLFRLRTGMLCRKCKIARTKKNASPEVKAEIERKKKATNIEKYGTENVFQSELIKEKSKKTLMEKYGVESTTQLIENQKKRKATCLKRYGFENSSQSPIIAAKREATFRERYGSNHPNFRYLFDNLTFDSSWELCYYIWCKDNGKCVKREPVKLKYTCEGAEHLYYPDFEVDGKLVEIKGGHMLKNGKLVSYRTRKENPRDTAKMQCMLANNVTILSTKEIQPYISYVRKLYGKKYLDQFRI